MEYTPENVAQLLEAKLTQALSEFKGRELSVIDVAVFPWHSEISISFLFSEDIAEEDDVAAWPYFDYSKIFEGGWEEARDMAEHMNAQWVQNPDPTAFFDLFGAAVRTQEVVAIINQFNLAPNFKVQVLNPDDPNSENYALRM